MFETTADLYAFAAMVAGFLIVIPGGMNLAHRLYGGGYVSVGSWLAIASFTLAFTAPLIYGKATGHPYLGGLAGVILGIIAHKVCGWLELSDGWTEEKPLDTLAAKRFGVGYALLGLILALAAGFLPIPLPVVFILGVAAATFGMASADIALFGYVKWQKEERRRSIMKRL